MPFLTFSTDDEKEQNLNMHSIIVVLTMFPFWMEPKFSINQKHVFTPHSTNNKFQENVANLLIQLL